MKMHSFGMDVLAAHWAEKHPKKRHLTLVRGDVSSAPPSMWKVATVAAVLGGVAAVLALEFMKGEWR
jgi:hypothetical protein